MHIVDMILSGSCMILVTLLLRKLLLYRLPKDTFVLMWLLAAFRLLLPLDLPFQYSILPYSLPSSMAKHSRYAATPTASEAINTAGPVLRISSEIDGAALIWAIGAMACGIFFLFVWFRGRQRFMGSIDVELPEATAFMKNHPLKRSVRLMQCDRISLPLTYGILHPVILLPNRRFEAADLGFILSHEWQHIRRFDGIKKALLVIAACVHWYNPLVWIMLIVANRDIELACDEGVLSRCGERKAYAMMLISIEEQRSGHSPVFSCLVNNQTEERIKAIMKMRSKTILSIAMSVVLVLTTCAAFAMTSVSDLKEQEFEQYEPYGLIYNAEDGRLYFDGKLVRYFEDMYPMGNDGEKAGSVFSSNDGEVDVYAVRDLSGDIVRNADGSFDPQGKLLGVEAYSQEEFDARTVEMEKYAAETGTAVENAGEGTNITVISAEDGTVEYAESHPVYVYTLEDDGPTAVYVTTPEGGYTYSMYAADVVYETDEAVGIIGGADEATSIFVSDTYEHADNGKLYPEMFAEYEAFGLTVEDNKLYYNGQHVRSFKDTYQVDFFRTVSCEHIDDDGIIDVIAVRDGKVLKGLKIVE